MRTYVLHYISPDVDITVEPTDDGVAVVLDGPHFHYVRLVLPALVVARLRDVLQGTAEAQR